MSFDLPWSLGCEYHGVPNSMFGLVLDSSREPWANSSDPWVIHGPWEDDSSSFFFILLHPSVWRTPFAFCLQGLLC